MNYDEALDIERKRAAAGLIPMFGEWQHRFPFAPVPYGNGKALAAFRARVQGELANLRFFYSAEIQLEVTLFVDMQSVLETSDIADLDNYAKAILDTLRGPSGIMFDDTQVQALCISWVDSHETYFTVAAKASPDDFMPKSVEFYEMPDGLWYPHGKNIWTDGEVEENSDIGFFAGLLIIQMMSVTQRGARIAFRKAGFDRLQAYRASRYFASGARGYHKSRIADAGFPFHSLADWTRELDEWKKSDPDHIAEIEVAMKDMKESYEAAIEAVVA